MTKQSSEYSSSLDSREKIEIFKKSQEKHKGEDIYI